MNGSHAPRLYLLSRCAWTLYNFRLALARAALEYGYKVTTLGQGGDGYDVKLHEAGIPFVSIPVSRRGLDPLRDVRLFFALVWRFWRDKPQIVHSFTIKPAIYGTLAAAAAGVPVRIVTITGLGHAFTSGAGWLRRMVEFLYRRALAHADVVYFQNADDQRLFQDRGLVRPSACRLVAGSGVDLTRFTPQPLPATAGVAPCFIMVSRLLREKGIIEYVQAASQIKSQYPAVRFLLAGGVDGRNPSSLSADDFAALNQDNAVEWLGELADVRPALAQADVVVLPSYREGTPRALLEGAAMGRPVITTDAVGCREALQVGQTGLMVPVGDVVALAGALQYFIENPAQIAAMGAAARRFVQEKFDEQAVIHITLEAYRELAEKKSR